GVDDPALATLFFHLGRYTLISGSRRGGPPIVRTGPWCIETGPVDGLALPMSYWPAETANLAPCHEPLLAVGDAAMTRGRAMATRLGCGGVTLGLPADDGRATPVTAAIGAGVVTRHRVEHTRFRGVVAGPDPLGAAAVAFTLDWLVADPRTGALHSGPSRRGGGIVRRDADRPFVVMGAAVDHLVIRTLLEEARRWTGDDGGDASRHEIDAVLTRLAPVGVAEDGRLMAIAGRSETTRDAGFPTQLYGVYPDDRITPRRTPALAAAARRCLEDAVAAGNLPAWAQAWMVGLGARLGDGAFAATRLRAVLADATAPNLLGRDHPGRIDVLLGATAGIAEMLVQSHEDAIDLLPALPPAWPDGSVRGLCARGGFVVDVRWRDGGLVEAEVHSRRGGPCSVRLADRMISFGTEAGGVYVLVGDDFRSTP
ncbi:MAG: hypothetical protein HKO59_04020, partial [Phycisphaerales bacterium]|nr:hypothetical protein [Phycisphaerales bacterium]